MNVLKMFAAMALTCCMSITTANAQTVTGEVYKQNGVVVGTEQVDPTLQQQQAKDAAEAAKKAEKAQAEAEKAMKQQEKEAKAREKEMKKQEK